MPSSLKCSHMLDLTRKVCISFLLLLHFGVELIGGAPLPGLSPSSQWDGVCNLVNGLVCGHDLDYFCHEGTNYCLPCGAYCTGLDYDKAKCKLYCPAYYADIHEPIVTSAAGTTSAATTDPLTSEPITSDQVSGITTTTVTTMTSENPMDKLVNAEMRYMLALCLLVIVIIVVVSIVIVLIVVCCVIRKRQNIEGKENVELTTVPTQCTQNANSRPESHPTENSNLLNDKEQDEEIVPNDHHVPDHRGSEDSNSTGQSARVENEIPSSEPCEQN